MDAGESSRMSAFASRSTAAARVSLGELSSDVAARVVSGLTTTRADGVEYDVDAAAPRTARRTAAILGTFAVVARIRPGRGLREHPRPARLHDATPRVALSCGPNVAGWDGASRWGHSGCGPR